MFLLLWPYRPGVGWGGAGGHEIPKEPSGEEVGRCYLGWAKASETQTCPFLALSGSRCQVEGISVNGDEDPGPLSRGSRRKESINSFGGFCCTFPREKAKIPHSSAFYIMNRKPVIHLNCPRGPLSLISGPLEAEGGKRKVGGRQRV